MIVDGVDGVDFRRKEVVSHGYREGRSVLVGDPFGIQLFGLGQGDSLACILRGFQKPGSCRI
jgi:hypothetical protein